MIIKSPQGSGTNYTFNNPLLGYTIDYHLSTKISKTANNQYSIWDNGVAYDKIILNCTWLLNLSEAADFSDIFSDYLKSRGSLIDIIVTTGSGFYPMGSQNGDNGTYTFIVVGYDQQSTTGNPSNQIYFNLKLQATGTIPSYTPDSNINVGSLSVGTIDNLRYPDAYHTPDYSINFVAQATEDSSYYLIDRLSGDKYESELNLVLPQSNMANLINYLKNTVRGNAVNIVTPANSYMFGIENSSTATYSCKLIQDVITQKHELYNRWSTTLKFSLINPVIEYESVYPSLSVYTVRAGWMYSDYKPYMACDPSKSLTGDGLGGSWYLPGVIAYQRFHIDVGSEQIIERIYYENFHISGAYTTGGIKTFTFWGTNSEAAFQEITYGIDTDWTQLTISSSILSEHTGSDIADPKYIIVTNSTAYRYYGFKFAENWGSMDVFGIRRIELQKVV
jgi:hypothetical protein